VGGISHVYFGFHRMLGLSTLKSLPTALPRGRSQDSKGSADNAEVIVLYWVFATHQQFNEARTSGKDLRVRRTLKHNSWTTWVQKFGNAGFTVTAHRGGGSQNGEM
jgi:hypothetical protein